MTGPAEHPREVGYRVAAMAESELQTTVRARLDGAEIHRDPFPHLVVEDLLPPDFFQRLAETMPPVDAFERGDKLKSNLHLKQRNRYFAQAPEEFQAVWSVLRDDVMRDVVAPTLTRRLASEIREKFASLFNAEIADEIMEGGLVSDDGRIMARKPGYDLKPHTDPAHFAVTTLLYFTAAADESSGALCLFRPERSPELRHVSTYFPEREEGIGVTLERSIPIQGNLFVAFLNAQDSLHGLRYPAGSGASGNRIAYQAHLVARDDLRKLDEYLERLTDPVGRRRWQEHVDRRRRKRGVLD
jgi:hypothetical protein